MGVGGSGKQSLSKLASHVSGYATYQLVISATYGVTDLKADLQQMYRRCGVKGEAVAFLFRDSQITDERFLVFMNDLLSSGNIPGLFQPEEQDDILNAIRPAAKRAGIAEERELLWAYFINQVQSNPSPDPLALALALTLFLSLHPPSSSRSRATCTCCSASRPSATPYASAAAASPRWSTASSSIGSSPGRRKRCRRRLLTTTYCVLLLLTTHCYL